MDADDAACYVRRMHASRKLFPYMVLLLATALLASCGGDTTAPMVYIVQYRLNLFGVTMDSVTYDNGHGTFVKIAQPQDGWTATLNVTSPGAVEAHGWGYGGATGTAKLKETWTLNGVSTESDSATASIASGLSVPVALDVPKHTF